MVKFAEIWMDAWSKPDSEAFSNLYAEDGIYTDVPFGITRVGRDFVRKHHGNWWKAVPDFKKVNERTIVSGSTITVASIDTGTFSGRALAEGRMEATHRSFRAKAVTILDLNEQGKIERCVEYYDRLTMPAGQPTLYNESSWEGSPSSKAASCINLESGRSGLDPS